MSIKFSRLSAIATLAIVGLGAATVFAHATFRPKSNNPDFQGREYAEGQSAFVSLVAAHGCRDEDGNRFATRHVYSVLPNAVQLGSDTFTENEAGQRFAGNAVMSVRPKADPNWGYISRISGEVPEFFSRGAQTEDVRALRWKHGHIPYDMYAELEFRVTLPTLAGCTERLRVYVPTVQYCEGGQKNVWVREATASFSEEEISPDFAPYFDVVRDLGSNPLPPNCGSGESLEAYPSAEDIDQYLVRKRRKKHHRH